MQIVIFAGGLGTRLRQVSGRTPKALVNVAGRPFLFWKLRELHLQDFSNILIATGYGESQIRTFLRTAPDLPVKPKLHSDRVSSPGIGQALMDLLPFLEETFVTTYGDTLLEAPLGKIVEHHDENLDALLTVATTQKPKGDNQLNIRCEGGRVTSFGRSEGLPPNTMDYGYAIWQREVLESSQAAPIHLWDLAKPAADKGQVMCFPVEENYREINTPASLAQLDAEAEAGQWRLRFVKGTK